MTTTDQPAGEPDTEGSYGASVNFAADFSSLTANIATVIKGKSTVIHLMALALIADGHVLVEDVPGVGKTSLGKALARSVDGRFGRVQFTPDLLPTDVTGVSVWNRGSDTFEFRPGPVFSNVLLADEINRASPKTQSALLEAMAERQVTSDGVTHQLASPFMVIATQNPIEHEGTYALPEAQLDRFLMRLEIGYPDRAAELEILESHGDTREPADHLAPVLTSAQISAMSSSLDASTWLQRCRATSSTSLTPPVATRVVTRHVTPRCAGSATNRSGPRRSRGPRYATPDDVKKLARYVIPHRLLVTPESRMRGARPIDIVTEILDGVPVPAPAGADMPTRTGWGLLVAGALFVVSGRLFGAIEFLVVGIAAVTAVVVAVLLRQLRPSRLSVVRQLTPPLVPVGEPARVDLEVINRSRSRSPVLRLLDTVAGTRGVDLALRRSPATVRCTAPTVYPPLVEGCSISDPSGSTMSKDSGSHASGTASTPGFG